MKLCDYRKMRGLTQEEMAEMIGVRRDSYGRYECGLRTPSRRVRRRIFEVTEGRVTSNDLDDLPDLRAARVEVRHDAAA